MFITRKRHEAEMATERAKYAALNWVYRDKIEQLHMARVELVTLRAFKAKIIAGSKKANAKRSADAAAKRGEG